MSRHSCEGNAQERGEGRRRHRSCADPTCGEEAPAAAAGAVCFHIEERAERRKMPKQVWHRLSVATISR